MINLYGFSGNAISGIDRLGLSPYVDCGPSCPENTGTIVEAKLDDNSLTPFKLTGSDGHEILAAGKVEFYSMDLKVCCKCVQHGRKLRGLAYQLRYSGKITAKIFLVSAYGKHNGMSRSPDGYARTKKHEEQHVKNFRTKFPDFLAKEFGDVSMTMTRDECSARMKLIDKGKIIKGWESEK